MIQPLDLDTIQARCNAAIPGPWYQAAFTVVGSGTQVADTAYAASMNNSHANAAFIAAARTDVPALIARVRGLEADLTEMTHCRNAALRALHRDDIETDIDVEQAIAAVFYGPGWDWEDGEIQRTAREIAATVRPALAKTTQQRDAALVRVRELEQLVADHEAAQGPLPCSTPHPVIPHTWCQQPRDHNGPHESGSNTWPDMHLPRATSAAHDAR
ncbi:hypothetical protein [Kitasatospora griseola]|uniref:hypothetical protein n=1 Tax=Kitasatospora griseola TaxID=2064 RepID=UPI00365E06A5